MDFIAWFLAGAIISVIGAVLGVGLGGWASWIGAILCGGLLTAVSRRLATLAGATLVCAVVGALVASSLAATVLVAALTVIVVLAFSMAGMSGWEWVLLRLTGDGSGSSDHSEDALHTVRGPTGPAPMRLVTPPTTTPDTPPKTVARLPAAQVARLVRLAERDTGSFRAALADLSAVQRQQVRQALSARRRRILDDVP